MVSIVAAKGKHRSVRGKPPVGYLEFSSNHFAVSAADQKHSNTDAFMKWSGDGEDGLINALVR